ncbi:uncharacterized protein B0H64DRAFT_359364 [Chaetomium fimeti]|uniref:Calponin-homology (CH) domain-containing protein n=1 Tax=Chaetomium fimeti TaxID=1854472 RepID=A0AAE0HH76_9PEZI|nr:hypothetical protein B0H64DRAFT_359364 [Chaetomium fimeti]
MASVSSLDKDLRKMRLDKYTPAAANEARQWIEEMLGERLPAGDLLDVLKDGVALCKLVNLAVGPPGVKFKKSAMPFVQMENISHFLRASQAPPLNLQQHDTFLTVDLYEQKDPAQVLQCLGAFSRAANSVNPAAFPMAIGPRSSRLGVVSPEPTGPGSPPGLRGRGPSNASNTSSLYGRPAVTPARTGDSGSGRWSPTKSPTQAPASPPAPVSSWSRREHEGATSPAWNIAQYGYMGGASQGNLGIAFGGRRQITSAGPHVPSIAEKEKRRKEQEAEAERQRQEEERRRQAEIEAEEERARQEEERRWEEETRRAREEEQRRLEEEKRQWAEEERQWKLTQEKRRREEEEAEARLKQERQNARKSNPQLRGQFLSQYQAEDETPEQARIRQLEQQLELARQREASYERERQGRSLRPGTSDDKKARSRSRSRAAQPVSRQDSWSVRDERNFIASQWTQHQQQLEQHDEEPDDAAMSPPPLASPRPLPNPAAMASPPMVKTHRTGEVPPALPIRNQHTGSRPLPNPVEAGPPPPIRNQHTGSRPLPNPAGAPPPTLPIRNQHTGSRPLPVPVVEAAPPPPIRNQHTGSRPLPNPVPPPNPVFASKSSPEASRQRQQPLSPQPPPKQTFARELPTSTADTPYTQQRRTPFSTTPTPAAPAPAPAQKKQTLLEREMELERQRQREWEEAQQETAARAAGRAAGDGGGDAGGVDGIGGGVGGRWDVSQWTGFTGGDSQNKGAQGIGAGRRQIVGPRGIGGPRPLPNPPR